MPEHKSAKKKLRHDEKRRTINRINRGKLRTQVKKFRSELEAGNRDALKEMFIETLSIIDKAIQKGVLHRNKAARLKSRLTKHYDKIMAATGDAEVPAKDKAK